MGPQMGIGNSNFLKFEGEVCSWNDPKYPNGDDQETGNGNWLKFARIIIKQFTACSLLMAYYLLHNQDAPVSTLHNKALLTRDESFLHTLKEHNERIIVDLTQHLAAMKWNQ